jgi:hypothetical protein
MVPSGIFVGGHLQIYQRKTIMRKQETIVCIIASRGNCKESKKDERKSFMLR